MSNRLAVETQLAVTDIAVPETASLVKWVHSAFTDNTAGELTLRVVDASEIRQLNTDFRQQDKVTNVLSFPAAAPAAANWGCEDAVRYWGDIAICAAVVNREAQEQHKAVQAHWAHIVMHGCLHLQGYDHQDDLEAAAMESKEIELLSNLGYANPYESTH